MRGDPWFHPMLLIPVKAPTMGFCKKTKWSVSRSISSAPFDCQNRVTGHLPGKPHSAISWDGVLAGERKGMGQTRLPVPKVVLYTPRGPAPSSQGSDPEINLDDALDHRAAASRSRPPRDA